LGESNEKRQLCVQKIEVFNYGQIQGQ